jgi:flagellar hook-length control protein FliK
MARNDGQQAELRLNPAHLGPLRISLHLEADKASANFLATTPVESCPMAG